MEDPLTVTQLNTLAKGVLKSSPGLNDVWVVGEISNLKRYTSGHYYFVLKDAGSQVSAVLFAGHRARMSFEPRENMKVVAFGSVDIYLQRGSYQFIVETMRQSGVGELYRRFAELKARLQAEGLFDASRKRPLPRYPRRIGVVTSETGAVIHDIITTSSTRFPADILLAPARVQGEGAAATIVAGIGLLDRYGVDVIIVGRGGGSLEDLWPFNEEPVARAISACGTPVVSAVGHETDFTIADFVADARAPTPTGAAAMVLRDRREVRAQVDGDMYAATRALSAVLDRMRARFDVLDARLSPEAASRGMAMRSMELDDLWSRARRAMESKASSLGSRLDRASARLSPAAALRDLGAKRERADSLCARASLASRSALAGASASLESASGRLEALNPTRVMERGYGIVLGPDGRAVTSVSGIIVGERLDVRLRDGTARTTVREIREERE